MFLGKLNQKQGNEDPYKTFSLISQTSTMDKYNGHSKSLIKVIMEFMGFVYVIYAFVCLVAVRSFLLNTIFMHNTIRISYKVAKGMKYTISYSIDEST